MTEREFLINYSVGWRWDAIETRLRVGASRASHLAITWTAVGIDNRYKTEALLWASNDLRHGVRHVDGTLVVYGAYPKFGRVLDRSTTAFCNVLADGRPMTRVADEDPLGFFVEIGRHYFTSAERSVQIQRELDEFLAVAEDRHMPVFGRPVNAKPPRGRT